MAFGGAKHEEAVWPRRELRAKDLERLNAVVEELKAKEKRGLTKDQKEELATAEKMRDFVEAGTDVRCACELVATSLALLQATAPAFGHRWRTSRCPEPVGSSSMAVSELALTQHALVGSNELRGLGAGPAIPWRCRLPEGMSDAVGQVWRLEREGGGLPQPGAAHQRQAGGLPGEPDREGVHQEEVKVAAQGVVPLITLPCLPWGRACTCPLRVLRLA